MCHTLTHSLTLTHLRSKRESVVSCAQCSITSGANLPLAKVEWHLLISAGGGKHWERPLFNTDLIMAEED